MKSATVSRFGSLLVALALGMALLNPGPSLAAQDETEEPVPPTAAPSPAPDRAPRLQAPQPDGALLLADEPPALGSVLVEDSLTAPGLISGPRRCSSGRNIGEFVGEGYILKVTGECSDGTQYAGIYADVSPELTVPDGEIRVEAKLVSGHNRALPFVVFRSTPDSRAFYELNLVPGFGIAVLGKSVPNETQLDILARRNDLVNLSSRDDWNDIAIRLKGPNIWVMLNGRLILSAADSSSDRGRVSLGLMRGGDLQDNTESAVVFRNLRISRLAE